MCRLCRHKFSTQLNKFQGMRLLDHVVSVCLVLLETTRLFSKVAVPFSFPAAVNESFSCSTSSAAFSVVTIISFLICILLNHREISSSYLAFHTVYNLVSKVTSSTVLVMYFFIAKKITNHSFFSLLVCFVITTTI